MTKHRVSLFWLTPLLATTLFVICWISLIGPQEWLIVLELAGVIFPIVWHLPDPVVMIGGLGISAFLLLIGHDVWQKVDLTVVAVMHLTSITPPLVIAILNVLFWLVTAPLAGLVLYRWHSARKLLRAPLTPVSGTEEDPTLQSLICLTS
eukprot:Blabericola_migrator_1__8641@NODE_4530_length_1104_cov_59_664417_g2807_i0_p1_GENE_NODE_4530_length_1104_cov_59_664417_g2807_i0NODE_4530_length_1104_cov_59_664417_g2807_i0_p1_ORF_typecomplete_len150_score9_93_NODE_4530_length_1104_cov_59_664417_g2807_i0216665